MEKRDHRQIGDRFTLGVFLCVFFLKCVLTSRTCHGYTGWLKMLGSATGGGTLYFGVIYYYYEEIKSRERDTD